ncbi:hypothetical protein CI109_103711 [Kwoniella shandongensis]|uniref:Uncharacterized protein n=1 Tax=Kwoniella shandongensis TaxID=1734106 RepID=A0A5M6C816_9TREE|nr:uncharacterized protein CI109_000593 [Kwoniella shandongensis]KAA5531021.1 hypothetical protein CI109_000593 [Kwoniella shandongensis]
MSSFNRRSTTPLSSLPSAGPASSSTSTSSPNHLNPSTNISQGQGEPQTAGVRLRRTSLLDALGVERGDERGLNEILQARRTAREVPGSDLSSGNGNGGERMRTPTLVQDSSTTSTGGLRPQAAPFRMREGRPQYVAAAPDHGGRIETGGGSASGSGSGTPAGAGALAPTPSGSGSGSARIGRRRTIVEIDSDTESDSSASLAVPPQPPRVRRQPQNPVFADLLAQMENISSDEDEEDDSYNPEPPVGGAGDLWGSDSGGDMSSSSSSSEEDFEVVGVNINRHRPAPVVQPSGEAGAAMELRSRAPMPVGDGRPNGYRRLPSPGHFARAIEGE